MEVDRQEEGWRLTARRKGGGLTARMGEIVRQEEGWRLTARRFGRRLLVRVGVQLQLL